MDEETTSKLNPSHHNRSLSRRQGKYIPQNFGYEVKIFKEKKNFQRLSNCSENIILNLYKKLGN